MGAVLSEGPRVTVWVDGWAIQLIDLALTLQGQFEGVRNWLPSYLRSYTLGTRCQKTQLSNRRRAPI